MQRIHVSTSDVLDTAADLNNYNFKIQTEFDKVDRSINTLTNNWNSPSMNTAINSFKKIKKNYQDTSKNSRFAVINSYVDCLREVVIEDYKDVEEKNTKIADAYK